MDSNILFSTPLSGPLQRLFCPSMVKFQHDIKGFPTWTCNIFFTHTHTHTHTRYISYTFHLPQLNNPKRLRMQYNFQFTYRITTDFPVRTIWVDLNCICSLRVGAYCVPMCVLFLLLFLTRDDRYRFPTMHIFRMQTGHKTMHVFRNICFTSWTQNVGIMWLPFSCFYPVN